MVNRLLSTTFFAFTFFLFTSPLAALMSPLDPGPTMKETGSNVIWVVREGETISGIAEAYYGDSTYWTTVWNDNPWIENPWYIEKDWVLELRNRIPREPQAIEPELMKRIANTPYFYSPEVQLHPSMVTIAITEVPSVDPNVQAITAEVIPPVIPTAVPTQPAQPAVTYSGGSLNEAQITYLGNCEAGMVANRNSGNGYYGAFQFSYGTWKSMNTGYERADLAPIEVQKDAVQRLLSRSSIFTQFPGCAHKMQSAGLL